MVSGALLTSTNGKKSDDEFYTRMEDIEEILKPFNLKDKEIYLCCDSEESNFVKYCKSKNLNYVNTSNDYKENESIFKNCDIIITNPPFSKWAEFFRYVLKFDKKFILFCPMLSLCNKEFIELNSNEKARIIYKVKDFIRPDGTKKSAAACVITNIMRRDTEWID